MEKIRSSEITPEHVYLNRRMFMKGIGSLAVGAIALSACGPAQSGEMPSATTAPATTDGPASPAPSPSASKETDELGDPLTPFESVTNYNNYYEFSMDKEAVAPLSKDFVTKPWTLTVGGLVSKPRTYAIEDLRTRFPAEERIYRLRCVEAWSMVIPWLGFPLADLLRDVEPLSTAKFVRFETLLDPLQMPGQRSKWYDWPYVEGLRMDEAMHPLTILSTGLYGKELLPQNGAPIRLVVPWKYGFKSIKSIVKLDLVEEAPQSLWMTAAPNEYGFYANVNPEVSHPRWSQASERRIGELGRRPTLPFNGYAEEVASLYAGMDLRANY
jgi:sulfoxide reductase catalytic subunit YedY